MKIVGLKVWQVKFIKPFHPDEQPQRIFCYLVTLFESAQPKVGFLRVNFQGQGSNFFDGLIFDFYGQNL